MNERIKKLRKYMDLTQQEFADRIGSKRTSIAKYETGTNVPSAAVVSLICREFNVNEEWLRTGIGEMFIEWSRADELSTFVDKLMQSEPDDIRRRFVVAISRLSTSELEVLEKMALHLTAEFAPNTETPLPSQPEEPHRITVEEAEAEYIKAMSERARRQERTALPTTADTRNAG